MKTLVVVQARTQSTRLPNKVLLPAVGKALLEHQLERIQAASASFDLVVATTPAADDKVIFDVCDRARVNCRAGHATDLLDRHFRIAIDLDADVVVKIPSDCPLIDPGAIERVIGHFRSGAFDYVSNLHPATYPDGNDVEVMTIEALESAFLEAARPFEREHTTPYIWERPERFRVDNVRWETGKDYSMTHRLTLDYQADYELVRAVYERLWTVGRPVFGLADILELLDREPALGGVNEHLRGVNWYRHHLDDLVHVTCAETRLLEEGS